MVGALGKRATAKSGLFDLADWQSSLGLDLHESDIELLTPAANGRAHS